MSSGNPHDFIQAPQATSRHPWLPAGLSALIAVMLFAVTLGGTYVYDDTILHEDPRFTHPHLWHQFWTKDYMPGAVDRLYRPLTCLSLAVQYAIHGERPWALHLVNVLLNAGVCAVVAELGRRLMGMRVAMVAGVLFAVHPIHVEAVAGLVGRAELLCTLATLGALVLFLKPMSGGRVLAIAACFVVAILSKEQGILLPAMLLVLIPYRGQFLNKTSMMGSVSHIKEPGELKLLAATLSLIAAAYLIIREQMLGFGWDRQHLDWAANPLIRSTGADRLLMPLVLIGRYLALLVAPLHLSLDYGSRVIGWTVNWHQPFVYLGAAVLIAWLVALGWSIGRRQWAVMFCLAALAISYALVSNSAILIGTIFGERLMYMPSAFFLILAAVLLERLFRPPVLTPIVIVLAALGFFRAFTYARQWNDPFSLYASNLQREPMSMHVHGLVAFQYLQAGKYTEAREVGRDALQKLPDCFQAYVICVNADLKMHDFADANRVLSHVDPRVPISYVFQLREGVAQEEAAAGHGK